MVRGLPKTRPGIGLDLRRLLGHTLGSAGKRPTCPHGIVDLLLQKRGTIENTSAIPHRPLLSRLRVFDICIKLRAELLISSQFDIRITHSPALRIFFAQSLVYGARHGDKLFMGLRSRDNRRKACTHRLTLGTDSSMLKLHF